MEENPKLVDVDIELMGDDSIVLESDEEDSIFVESDEDLIFDESDDEDVAENQGFR